MYVQNGSVIFYAKNEPLLDIVGQLIIIGALPEDIINEYRHEWISPYSYCGVAPKGTGTNSSVWVITRIEVNLDGTTTEGTATGAWDDRTTLIYT